MIVVKAKIARDTAMITPPNPGSAASKAAEVSAAPVAPLVQTPVDRIADRKTAVLRLLRQASYWALSSADDGDGQQIVT